MLENHISTRELVESLVLWPSLTFKIVCSAKIPFARMTLFVRTPLQHYWAEEKRIWRSDTVVLTEGLLKDKADSNSCATVPHDSISMNAKDYMLWFGK